MLSTNQLPNLSTPCDLEATQAGWGQSCQFADDLIDSVAE